MSINEDIQTVIDELSTTNLKLQDEVADMRAAHDNLANLMRLANVTAFFLNEELQLTFFTPACRSVFSFVATDLGRKIDDIGADIDMAQLRNLCSNVLKLGLPIEKEIETEDGSRRYTVKVEACCGHGTPTSNGVVCSLTDVTILSRMITDARAEQWDAQCSLAELEKVYFVSPLAMALLSPDTTYLRVNRQMATINGLTVEAHCGKKVSDIVPDLSEQICPVFENVLRDGEPVIGCRIEGLTAAHADEKRLFLTDWYPVRIKSEIVAVGVNFQDITAQTEEQAELRRMMQELQHRTKNVFSNVLALLSRARREADFDFGVLDTLAARIRALSHTDRLLYEENWHAVDIYAVIQPELADVYGSERVQLAGAKILVNARAAAVLGMAFHELATNAAKYGAFSQGRGAVTLTWMRMGDGFDERVLFRWAESDGPEIKEQTGTGFGSQLIASAIAGSLQGSVEKRWNPDGLVVDITVPYDALSGAKEDVVHDVF